MIPCTGGISFSIYFLPYLVHIYHILYYQNLHKYGLPTQTFETFSTLPPEGRLRRQVSSSHMHQIAWLDPLYWRNWLSKPGFVGYFTLFYLIPTAFFSLFFLIYSANYSTSKHYLIGIFKENCFISISDRCSHAVSLSPLRCDASLVSSNMSASISIVERPSQPVVCSQHTATYFSLGDISMFPTVTVPTRVSSPSPAVFLSA